MPVRLLIHSSEVSIIFVVTTYECDASDAYKQSYIDAKKEDIVIVQSPVGMPGRAILNPFMKRAKSSPSQLIDLFNRPKLLHDIPHMLQFRSPVSIRPAEQKSFSGLAFHRIDQRIRDAVSGDHGRRYL